MRVNRIEAFSVWTDMEENELQGIEKNVGEERV